MLFNRQISAIILFFTILILLIYPNYNNIMILIIKGIAIGALAITFTRYAFPNILNKKLLDKNIETDSQNIPDLSAIQSHYKKLIEQIIDLVSVVNPKYNTAIYMTDLENSGYKKQNSSNFAFKDFVNINNIMISKIIKNNKPIIIKHNKDESWEEIFGEKTWRGSEVIIGFPIKYSDKTVGCLLVFSNHFSSINDNDKSIIEKLVGVITKGMTDLEELDLLLADNYFSARINNLFDQLEVKSDQSELFESIRGICRAFFQYDKLTLILSDNGKNAKIKLVDGIREDADEGQDFNLDNSLHGLAVKKNKLINSNSWIENFPELYRFFPGDKEKFNFMSILSSPIKSKESSIGAITLERLKSRRYSKTDEKLLELLCNTVSTILVWQQEYYKVHQSAMHDGLTGLLNHKTFLDRFDEEISRAKRFNHNLGLVVLDLDKFKVVNDSYGHLHGDYVLKEVSNIIAENVRAIDVVGRYGGEEFAVLLVNTDIEACLPLAQRIVDKIAEKVFLKSGISLKITISAGMAGYPLHAESVRELISKADNAMYVTKSKGGNGISIATN
ncbi:MAG: GGDEF domain-containing protein [Candidatus Marinimicrobia bacterium]|nr:GGDEF domain-containing protein [Candidatus Neomarinimicrobiota bacterium]